jgi:hypothetical protein
MLPVALEEVEKENKDVAAQEAGGSNKTIDL